MEDLRQLLCCLKISKAHVAGLSMGGGVALNFGIRHPEMCASLVVASCGAGSVNREQFKRHGKAVVERLEKEGIEAFADFINEGPSRVQLRKKDPRGWQESRNHTAEHSAIGSAFIFRGVQLERPTIFDLETRLDQLQVPTLLLIGDEDEACIDPALFMKRHIPHASLMVFPRSGHAINLEEPDLFNRTVLDFLSVL